MIPGKGASWWIDLEYSNGAAGGGKTFQFGGVSWCNVQHVAGVLG